MALESNSNMDKQEKNDDWQACPPGAIAGVTDQLVREHRSQQVRKVATWGGGVLAVVLVVVAAAQWFPSRDSVPAYGGITCEVCVAAMPDYQQHLVFDKPMTEPTAVAMQQHLEDCHLCHAKFERRFPGVLSALLRETGRSIAQAPLGHRVLATNGTW